MTNKHVLNINIPHRTHQQLEDMKREQRTTKTQLVITAVDHLKREGEKYQGWTNHETWLIALHLNNEQALHNTLREMAREAKDKYTAAEAIEEWVDELNPWDDACGMFSDLMNTALGKVNWIEIAEDAREE